MTTTANLLQATSTQRHCLRREYEDAARGLSTANEQLDLAARLLAANTYEDDGLHVAPDRYVTAYRRRVSERDAAQQRVDAAWDAWEVACA